jgi:hypothetical protein
MNVAKKDIEAFIQTYIDYEASAWFSGNAFINAGC